MPSWIKLRVPAFGQPANTVLRVDSPDQAAQLLNGGFADTTTDPGGAPSAVPVGSPGGDFTTDAELAAALAGLGAGGAAPATDAAREAYVPARLSDASLKAAYVTRAENARHYLRATFGSGQSGGPTFAVGRSFTTAPLDTVGYDTAGAFDPVTGFYRVALTGYYDVNASLRTIDGASASINVGLGVDTDNVDSPTFVWGATTAALRNTFTYARNAHFAAGDQVRLFSYADSAGLLFTAAALSLSLIGQG